MPPLQMHELNEDDFDRRIQFWAHMMNLCKANEGFTGRISFSDEATFYLNRTVNRQNSLLVGAQPSLDDGSLYCFQKSQCVGRNSG
ncbi:hypothetical protein NQ317_017722 [Molorchus minor]|uniref:Uncharacterized protein n=1 Tax=Molorchus minor TaxID=1323400 RepID=A0ABQ9J6V4_9CUCU|nr:hypothetical protein NQ317_017722 [Molorchus minor]